MGTQIYSIGLRLFGALLSMGQTVLLARTLGAEGLGLYSALLAVATVIAIPMNAGMPPFLTREVARLSVSDDETSVWSIVSAVNRVVLALSAAGMVVMFLLTRYGLGSGAPLSVAVVGALLIPLLSLDLLRAGVMRGLGSALVAQLPENIVRPGGFLCAIVLMNALGVEVGVAEAVGAFVAAASVSALLGQLLLLRMMPRRRGASARFKLRDVILRSRGLTLLGMTNTMMSNVDIILFTVFSAFVALGQYRVSLVGVVALLLVYNAVADVARRDFARGLAEGNIRSVVASADKVTLLGVAWLGTVTCAYAAFGNTVINIVFGSQFGEAYPALVILSIGHVLAVSCGPSVELSMALPSQRMAVRSSFVGILVLGVLGVFLVQWDPLMGIAISSAIANVVRRFLLSRVAGQAVGDDVSIMGALSRLKG